MTYTLTQAAAATGKVRSTIFKACKSGKISYTMDEHDEIQIDPAELHRVYPPVSKNVRQNVENETRETMRNGNGNSLLEQEIQFLREKLADLERMKDSDRELLSRQIEDLRGERDRLLNVIEEQAGSVRQLTDQRHQPQPEPVPAPAPAPAPPAQPKGLRGFLHRLTG